MAASSRVNLTSRHWKTHAQVGFVQPPDSARAESRYFCPLPDRHPVFLDGLINLWRCLLSCARAGKSGSDGASVCEESEREERLALFYFHFVHGATSLDHAGVDLPDMAAVRSEAVAMIADILHDGSADFLWAGKPLRLWVTDQPNGAGKMLFALNVTATGAEQEQECLATVSAKPEAVIRSQRKMV
jgi:hypothetical protein